MLIVTTNCKRRQYWKRKNIVKDKEGLILMHTCLQKYCLFVSNIIKGSHLKK